MSHASVVIGLLGIALDRGDDADRWNSWRPTVALCQHDDFRVDRLELIYQQKYRPLLDQVIEDINSVSPETKVEPFAIEMDDPWDFERVFSALHDFARAYPFATDREDYFVHMTTGTHVAQICLFLLTESRHIPGRIIQTSPPKRIRQGPAGKYRVIDLDLSKYDRLAARFEREQQTDLNFLKSGIPTRNRQFNTLIEEIERVAIRSHEPILLMGPTGAGKTQLARRIYELKKSKHAIAGDFVEVNSATLRGDQAMSALFGHVKGAFTGAMHAREGLLRRAHNGLLFLDEIGDLGADEQAMLLRAIEEKQFLPVGSDREIASDFQLIAGTHRNLHPDVRDGRFRADLLARISLWTFRLPGLCERVEDIEPNIEYELSAYTQRTGRRIAFSREARDAFLNFATSSESSWSGNFRDLNGAITRMATLAMGGRISEVDVDQEIRRLKSAWGIDDATVEPGMSGDAPALTDASPMALRRADDLLLSDVIGGDRVAEIDRFDRSQLAEVIRACRSARSLSEAGRSLFAASRKLKSSSNDADRLRKYLSRFSLNWDALRV